MEMENQYGGMSDLRQFISIAAAGGPPQFLPYGQQQQPPPQQQQPSLLLSEFMTAHNHNQYSTTNNNNNNSNNSGMVVMGRQIGTSSSGPPNHPYQDNFNCDSATTATTAQGNNFDVGDGGTARWPRQETLTLLEIRSRLDHKFKEANQKGPLWDEVARIMCEEHGYQRSGKKCREKFENLYKYYKKTKEGKAGRQDGKHYRFFRQLEALYGEHNHPISTSEVQNTENAPQFHNTHPLIPPHQPTTSLVPPPARGCDTSVSLSNSSNFDSSSSDDDEDGSTESNGSMETQKKKKKTKKKRRGHSSNWKAKIKEFIDLQMRKIMEKQEFWLEKMMSTLESRENERLVKEEEWRKQEVDRVEREHKFWASERAWIEARDSALMATLEKLTNNNNNNNNRVVHHQWPEHEVTRLIQVRTSMESRFQQCGFSEEVLWEDIATKMAYLGYDRSASVCKEKWDSINNYFRGKSLIKDNEGKKKRKENYGVIHHHQQQQQQQQQHNHHHNPNQSHNHSNEGGIYMNQLSGFNNCEINEPIRLQLNEGSSSPSSHNSNVNANNINNAAGNVMNDSCLRFFLGDGESNLGWESSNYALKLNNNGNNNNNNHNHNHCS